MKQHDNKSARLKAHCLDRAKEKKYNNKSWNYDWDWLNYIIKIVQNLSHSNLRMQ